jgi:hypothetical protein
MPPECPTANRTRGRRTSSRFEIASRNAPSEDEVSAF